MIIGVFNPFNHLNAGHAMHMTNEELGMHTFFYVNTLDPSNLIMNVGHGH